MAGQIQDFQVSAQKASSAGSESMPSSKAHPILPPSEGPFRHVFFILPSCLDLKNPVSGSNLDWEEAKAALSLTLALPSSEMPGESTPWELSGEDWAKPSRISLSHQSTAQWISASKLAEEVALRRLDFSAFKTAINHVGLPSSLRDDLVNQLFTAAAGSVQNPSLNHNPEMDWLVNLASTPEGIAGQAPAGEAMAFMHAVGSDNTGFIANPEAASHWAKILKSHAETSLADRLGSLAVRRGLGIGCMIPRMLKACRGRQSHRLHIIPSRFTSESLRQLWEHQLENHPGRVEAVFCLETDLEGNPPQELTKAKAFSSLFNAFKSMPGIFFVRQNIQKWNASILPETTQELGKTKAPADGFYWFSGHVSEGSIPGICLPVPSVLAYILAWFQKGNSLMEAGMQPLTLELDAPCEKPSFQPISTEAFENLRAQGWNIASLPRNSLEIRFGTLLRNGDALVELHA